MYLLVCLYFLPAIFKQHGYEVKELPEEDLEPLIDCNGTLKVKKQNITFLLVIPLMPIVLGNKFFLTFQVWRVDGDELCLVPDTEQKKLFGGDCYVVQYMYSDNGREENLFYAWLGRQSVQVCIILTSIAQM